MDVFDAHMRSGYVGRAEIFDRTFGRLCAYPAPELLDAVTVSAGRLLDVGCGSGSVTTSALSRGADVTAVDTEGSMLDLTRERAPDAAVLRAALPSLPFPDDSFDAIVASFVLNHVSDPLASLTELARVLRPGGRVAATIWPHPPTPLHELLGRVLTETGLAPTARPVRLAPDKDFDRDPDGFAGLLTRAGFAAVTCRRIDWTHRVDPEVWWSGPANGLHELGKRLVKQPPDTVARVKRHYDLLAREYLTDSGDLALPTAALLAVGTAP